MKMRSPAPLLLCSTLLLFGLAPRAWSGGSIPKASWKRPIGAPIQGAGVKEARVEGEHIDDGFWQGAPVGGFGAGTFSMTYRGDFARWHLMSGVHKYQTVYSNAFAMYQKEQGQPDGVAQVLFTDHPKHGELGSWKWDYPVGAGNYYALYPKSWFDYDWDKFPAHVTLEQFSPILPDNYKESSYPIAVYRWHAENPSTHKVTVSVMFSWTNMLGWFRTYSRQLSTTMNDGNYNKFKSEPLGGSGKIKGILFQRERAGAAPEDWDGQFAIASIESPGVEVSYQTTFDPQTDASEVWSPFSRDGRLANSDEHWTSGGDQVAGAIAVRFVLAPGEKRVVPMVIAWDLPSVEFGSGRKWNRRYTDFFGTSGNNAWAIAREGLRNATAWSDAIDAWQAPYVTDESRPSWYRGMLFNELYILADGGSFWGRPAGSDRARPARFAFLECFDYNYYSTLDVWFYGSLPLAKFWPDIDKEVLREFAETVPRELPEKIPWVWKSQQLRDEVLRERKAKGALPHDLGGSGGDPFYAVNQYDFQDPNGWKDLNTKFVLLIYRDFVWTGSRDKEFLKSVWPSVRESIAYLQKFAKDDSGIPENEGIPDQTYDEWEARGISAYCGGLWLATLRAAEEMAKQVGDDSAASQYHSTFVKGRTSYIQKLWNGTFFSYDTGSHYQGNIQADQLAGQWYANLTGLGDLVPHEMQVKALKTIFDCNVMKFANGEMGAVNGIGTDGSTVNNSQAREVWTGITLALAGFMLSDGLEQEAYRTAWGIYHVNYETKGYWFRTPEAWDGDGNFRASMYMRPAAVWALEMTKPPAIAVREIKSR